MSEMNFTIDEILNEAIMTSIPAIVVEGKNDIKIYRDIAKSAGKDAEIYPIEVVEGYSQGCESVIKAIRELYALNGNVVIKDYILGVIDRDVREFRNEIPTEDAFLVLDFYSIESYFVSKEVLEDAIARYTLVGKSALAPQFIENRYNLLEERLLELYYFSLESLQFSLDSSYMADFRYSYSNNRRKLEPMRSNVQAKIPALDQFAASLQISRDIQWLRKISTGKWLLRAFCEEIYQLLESFSDHCGVLDASQCLYCKRSFVNKCTYKLKEGVSNVTIYSLALENISIPAFNSIRARIAALV